MSTSRTHIRQRMASHFCFALRSSPRFQEGYAIFDDFVSKGWADALARFSPSSRGLQFQHGTLWWILSGLCATTTHLATSFTLLYLKVCSPGHVCTGWGRTTASAYAGKRQAEARFSCHCLKYLHFSGHTSAIAKDLLFLILGQPHEIGLPKPTASGTQPNLSLRVPTGPMGAYMTGIPDPLRATKVGVPGAHQLTLPSLRAQCSGLYMMVFGISELLVWNRLHFGPLPLPGQLDDQWSQASEVFLAAHLHQELFSVL